MTVSMSAGEYVVPLRERIVVLIIEILPSQFTIPLPGAVLICQKEVLRDGDYAPIAKARGFKSHARYRRRFGSQAQSTP
jgi:hypothetical protein